MLKEETQELYGKEPINLSHPLTIKIKNTGDSVRNFKLFGFNKFNKKRNFGNHSDVKIKGLKFLYDEYFNAISSLTFKIMLIRIRSENNKNLQDKLCYYHSNPFTGIMNRSELNLSVMMDAYQHQKNILDIRKAWTIDKFSYLSGTIQANTVIQISIYPSEINDECFKVEKLSGKVLDPVIINTNSNNEKDLKNVIDLSVPENSHFEIQLPLSKQKLKEFENQVIASKTNKNGKKKIIH